VIADLGVDRHEGPRLFGTELHPLGEAAFDQEHRMLEILARSLRGQNLSQYSRARTESIWAQFETTIAPCTLLNHSSGSRKSPPSALPSLIFPPFISFNYITFI
jgi:hypothetical protein